MLPLTMKAPVRVEASVLAIIIGIFVLNERLWDSSSL
jgi:hypothetical protein